MSLQESWQGFQKCLYYVIPYNIYTQIPPSPNLSKYLNVLFHSHLGDGHATWMCKSSLIWEMDMLLVCVICFRLLFWTWFLCICNISVSFWLANCTGSASTTKPNSSTTAQAEPETAARAHMQGQKCLFTSTNIALMVLMAYNEQKLIFSGTEVNRSYSMETLNLKCY